MSVLLLILGIVIIVSGAVATARQTQQDAERHGRIVETPEMHRTAEFYLKLGFGLLVLAAVVYYFGY